ncbi:hypothetical protein ACJX0J_017040, partial [Zea mays]
KIIKLQTKLVVYNLKLFFITKFLRSLYNMFIHAFNKFIASQDIFKVTGKIITQYPGLASKSLWGSFMFSSCMSLNAQIQDEPHVLNSRFYISHKNVCVQTLSYGTNEMILMLALVREQTFCNLAHVD